jgi:DNA polymerase-3 subunit beta
MIYSRLVEGRYPPYREVSPQKQTVKVHLGVGPFYTAIRQAAVMTDDESKMNRIGKRGRLSCITRFIR